MEANPVATDLSAEDLEARCKDGTWKVLSSTQKALEVLASSWDEGLVRSWAEHIVQGSGRVVLSGMGKSGLVAQKISATLASTGCPSFFMHPADALHGDLGMVTERDSVILLSNSGESEEILKLLSSLIRLGVPIGAITSQRDSRLGQAARWCFTYKLPEGEGSPLSFAPMASTSLQMVWGDMLAAYQMIFRGFTLEGYATLHPAGNIGSRLIKVEALMHREFPRVEEQADLVTVLGAMTKGKLGMTTVQTEDCLLGVVSDGDIRRAMEKAQSMAANPLDLRAKDIMTRHPVTVEQGGLAVEAARSLEARKITFLVVMNHGKPCGILHIHDLLEAKVI